MQRVTLNHNMNSASGIGASQELLDTFASAVESVDVRIIKVSIKDGALQCCPCLRGVRHA